MLDSQPLLKLESRITSIISIIFIVTILGNIFNWSILEAYATINILNPNLFYSSLAVFTTIVFGITIVFIANTFVMQAIANKESKSLKNIFISSIVFLIIANLPWFISAINNITDWFSSPATIIQFMYYSSGLLFPLILIILYAAIKTDGSEFSIRSKQSIINITYLLFNIFLIYIFVAYPELCKNNILTHCMVLKSILGFYQTLLIKVSINIENDYEVEDNVFTFLAGLTMVRIGIVLTALLTFLNAHFNIGSFFTKLVEDSVAIASATITSVLVIFGKYIGDGFKNKLNIKNLVAKWKLEDKDN